MESDSLSEHPLHEDDLLGLNSDVGGLALEGAADEGLVHQDSAMGKRVALSCGTGAQKELAH